MNIYTAVSSMMTDMDISDHYSADVIMVTPDIYHVHVIGREKPKRVIVLRVRYSGGEGNVSNFQNAGVTDGFSKMVLDNLSLHINKCP